MTKEIVALFARLVVFYTAVGVGAAALFVAVVAAWTFPVEALLFFCGIASSFAIIALCRQIRHIDLRHSVHRSLFSNSGFAHR